MEEEGTCIEHVRLLRGCALGVSRQRHVYTQGIISFFFCYLLQVLLSPTCDKSLLESTCSLIHAYAVGRDMEEALSCVRKMKEEGIEMSLVTYSVIVGGFSKAGNAE